MFLKSWILTIKVFLVEGDPWNLKITYTSKVKFLYYDKKCLSIHCCYSALTRNILNNITTYSIYKPVQNKFNCNIYMCYLIDSNICREDR